MITLTDYWKGRNILYGDELTEEILGNAEVTVARCNELLNRAGRAGADTVNSGWRPQSVNDATANSAKGSKHLTAEAVDLADPDGSLAQWCMDHVDVLVELELWMEHPGWTVGWVHLQTLPPGNPPRARVRVFIPSSAPARRATFGTAPVVV